MWWVGVSLAASLGLAASEEHLGIDFLNKYIPTLAEARDQRPTQKGLERYLDLAHQPGPSEVER